MTAALGAAGAYVLVRKLAPAVVGNVAAAAARTGLSHQRQGLKPMANEHEKLLVMQIAAELTVAACVGAGGAVPIDPSLRDNTVRAKAMEVWEMFRSYVRSTTAALADDVNWPPPAIRPGTLSAGQAAQAAAALSDPSSAVGQALGSLKQLPDLFGQLKGQLGAAAAPPPAVAAAAAAFGAIPDPGAAPFNPNAPTPPPAAAPVVTTPILQQPVPVMPAPAVAPVVPVDPNAAAAAALLAAQQAAAAQAAAQAVAQPQPTVAPAVAPAPVPAA